MIEQRPDVLLLCVDDMNDWVGCLDGYPGVSTPNIDRLAACGTLFGNAHCPSPVCNPSRSAILTGWAHRPAGVAAGRVPHPHRPVRATGGGAERSASMAMTWYRC